MATHFRKWGYSFGKRSKTSNSLNTALGTSKSNLHPGTFKSYQKMKDIKEFCLLKKEKISLFEKHMMMKMLNEKPLDVKKSDRITLRFCHCDIEHST